ncbi:hypothetical protein AVBRAN9334_08935 [Campylobacter sp. RM9334]|uniref:hypothetical protein n=1 Tax=Campylobacter sp. RM9334 TaxID=2735732 RepID=UPI001D745490|nr:hypothetical protein [Campylobacter sp. RM9334]
MKKVVLAILALGFITSASATTWQWMYLNQERARVNKMVNNNYWGCNYSVILKRCIN